MPLIIGLTGSKASGKGEIAEFLKKDGAIYFSLSDIVREKAKQKFRNKPYTVADMQKLGNQLREKGGNGVLAKLLIPKLRTTEYAIVDGIRNLGEIEVLRRFPGFYLVGVDAYVKTRFERMQKRARPTDPKTFEEFLKMDKIDQGYGEKASGQQVSSCINISDYMMFNDGLSLDELRSTFQQQFLNLIKGLIKRRPTKDETWMSITHDVMKRSTCLRRQIGATLISSDGYVLATGYNGTPRGFPHCSELGGCLRKKLNIPSGTKQEVCRAVHAEENVIIQAAKKGIAIENSILYATISPCIMCARKLINAGIKKIIYDGSYPDKMAIEMLNKANIPMKRFTGVRPRVYHLLFK